MTTQSLQHFIQVYENGSLSAAAKKNFITPQGMSKAIKQIEQEFDIALFTRQSNQLVPTPEGHLMYIKAVEVLNIVKDLNHSFNQSGKNENALGIVVSQSVSSFFPPSFLAGIQEQPVKVKEISDDYDIQKYMKTHYDFGLFSGDSRQFEGYHKCKLQSGEIMILVPEGHDYYGKMAISIDALRGKKVVLHAFCQKDKHIFLEKCLENGFLPDIVQEVINFQSGLNLCRQRKHVMISTDYMIKAHNIHQYEHVQVYPRMAHNIYLVAHPQRVSKQVFEKIAHSMMMRQRESVWV